MAVDNPADFFKTIKSPMSKTLNADAWNDPQTFSSFETLKPGWKRFNTGFVDFDL